MLCFFCDWSLHLDWFPYPCVVLSPHPSISRHSFSLKLVCWNCLWIVYPARDALWMFRYNTCIPFMWTQSGHGSHVTCPIWIHLVSGFTSGMLVCKFFFNLHYGLSINYVNKIGEEGCLKKFDNCWHRDIYTWGHTPNIKTTLDLVITSFLSNLSPEISFTFDTPSDHYPIFTLPNILPASRPDPASHSFRRISPISIKAFMWNLFSTDCPKSSILSWWPLVFLQCHPLHAPWRACSCYHKVRISL